jgi:hypothetical protein
MVVVGRAFHWMDRAESLRRLDDMIDPDGAVVLFGDEHPGVPDNRWQGEYRALLYVCAQAPTASQCQTGDVDSQPAKGAADGENEHDWFEFGEERIWRT